MTIDTETDDHGILVDVVTDTLISELGDTYDCGRVWSAWSVGTMGEDDFEPASERASEIAASVLAAIQMAGFRVVKAEPQHMDGTVSIRETRS